MKEYRDLNIAVLCGGSSPEREVSLQSGKNAFEALKKIGLKAKMFDLDREFYLAALNNEIDVVFIALHGSPGEDGTVQGFLEALGIEYAGSGVLASAICMDKSVTKKLLRAEGVPVPDYLHLCSNKYHASYPEDISSIVERRFGFPVVVKPSRLGSSVGVSIVRSSSELKNAIEKANEHDCCVLIEEFIAGREIQCGIIGREHPTTLPLIEIVPKKEFFDYEAKYVPGMADEISPAPLSEELTKYAQEMAYKAFKVVGCRDMARVDMFLTDNDKFLVSEINTIPGLTQNSLLPKEARAAGMSYEELIFKIIEPALQSSIKNKARP